MATLHARARFLLAMAPALDLRLSGSAAAAGPGLTRAMSTCPLRRFWAYASNRAPSPLRVLAAVLQFGVRLVSPVPPGPQCLLSIARPWHAGSVFSQELAQAEAQAAQAERAQAEAAAEVAEDAAAAGSSAEKAPVVGRQLSSGACSFVLRSVVLFGTRHCSVSRFGLPPARCVAPPGLIRCVYQLTSMHPQP